MVRWMLLIVVVAACSRVAGAGRLKPADVAGFFVTPDKAAVLRWRVEAVQPGGGKYVVRDYWGKTAATGEAKTGPKGGLEAAVKLPRGFYDIEFPGAKRRFGVVSIEAFQASLYCFHYVISRAAPVIRVITHWVVELGGDDNLRTFAFYCFTYELLGSAPITVHVSSIDVVDAQV